MPTPQPLPELPLDVRPRALRLPRRGIVLALSGAAALLLAASAAMAVLRIGYGHDVVFGLSHFLDVDREHSLPTWYESTLMSLVALLMVLVAALEWPVRRGEALRWTGLAAVAAFLSLDEASMLHERFVLPLDRLGALGPVQPYTWVAAGLVPVVLVTVVFLRFVLGLRRRTRNGILCGGALFLTGALGMEVAGGAWVLGAGGPDAVSAAMVTLEEGLEMAGMLVVVDALLGHLGGMGAWRTEVG